MANGQCVASSPVVTNTAESFYGCGEHVLLRGQVIASLVFLSRKG